MTFLVYEVPRGVLLRILGMGVLPGFPLSDLNGAKTLPFGMAHTRMALIGSAPSLPSGIKSDPRGETKIIFAIPADNNVLVA